MASTSTGVVVACAAALALAGIGGERSGQDVAPLVSFLRSLNEDYQ
jgi:hypothetical protein